MAKKKRAGRPPNADGKVRKHGGIVPRWLPEELAKIEKAASSVNETSAGFVRAAALERARKVLKNGK